MATVALLENEVKYMRCALCDNFLSVAPVMTISDDGKENQCGRCQNIKSDLKSTRNVCYENLARFLRFPCIYRNCPELIQWNEVEEHEKNCAHKAIQCPLYYQKNCTAIIEVEELEGHMNRLHRSNTIYGDTVCKKISIGMSSVYYLVPNEAEGRFLVYITPEVVFVGSLGSQSKYATYTLKMTANNSEDKCLFFDNVRIVEYEERLHCFRCLKEKCDLIHHHHSKLNDNGKNEDFLHVDKDLVTKFLQHTTNISISLTILRDSELEEQSAALVSYELATTSNTSVLRRHFTCTLCREYMMSKIFRCEIGHKVCESCELRVKECHLCQRKFRRCHMVEDLVKSMVLCCLGEGCYFTGSLEALALHEQTCYLKRED